jgi:hypothetical protein
MKKAAYHPPMSEETKKLTAEVAAQSKRKDGTINAAAVAKKLGMSRDAVRKRLMTLGLLL